MHTQINPSEPGPFYMSGHSGRRLAPLPTQKEKLDKSQTGTLVFMYYPLVNRLTIHDDRFFHGAVSLNPKILQS